MVKMKTKAIIIIFLRYNMAALLEHPGNPVPTSIYYGVDTNYLTKIFLAPYYY
jgi:hypothetical protein